jgi:anaerobic dimethyl sulfoxide reductase subunit C
MLPELATGRKSDMDRRHSEWQLVGFTILTQMAVGVFAFWGLATVIVPGSNSLLYEYAPGFLAGVLGLLMLGTLAAGLHLGSPLRALFSLKNIRKSWLSREALLAASFALLVLILLLRRRFELGHTTLDQALIFMAIFLGNCLVYGISRLYMLRTVPAWNNLGTPATFFNSTFLLGAVGFSLVMFGLLLGADSHLPRTTVNSLVTISFGLILLFVVLQWGTFTLLILSLTSQKGVAAESVRILWMNLRSLLIWRGLTGFVGIGILAFLYFGRLFPFWGCLASGLILVSEILGRFLFYGFYQREGY